MQGKQKYSWSEFFPLGSSLKSHVTELYCANREGDGWSPMLALCPHGGRAGKYWMMEDEENMHKSVVEKA